MSAYTAAFIAGLLFGIPIGAAIMLLSIVYWLRRSQ